MSDNLPRQPPAHHSPVEPEETTSPGKLSSESSDSGLRELEAIKQVMSFFREHYEFDRNVFQRYLKGAAWVVVAIIGILSWFGYQNAADIRRDVRDKATEEIAKQFERPTIKATIEEVAREEIGTQVRKLAPGEIRRLMQSDPDIIKAIREEIRKQSLPMAAQEVSIALAEVRRPRKLTTEQSAKLRMGLSKSPRSVEIGSLAGDEERFDYAQSIADVFKSAAWKTFGPERTSYEKDYVGLLIIQCPKVVNQEALDSIREIKRIFDAAGVSIRVEPTEACSTLGWQLVVGAKP